jgi:glycyl-tRNA synthetase beta chain
VHWAVLLFGQEVISAEILGVMSGAETRGHRFHAPKRFTLTHPEEYLETLLQKGKVIVDFEQRKNIIRNTAQKAAQAVNSVVHIEEDLLEEITALNEWPVPITGNFDEKYLALPDECLITTMQTNQKYFPVIGEDGKLLPHFITFSNIESTRPESIQQGNERVITPRLADAEFFWNQDRKQSLEARTKSLSTIIFQKKLGPPADKTTRVSLLAEYIAQQLDASVVLAKRAAQLAKTDLMTEMVGEFPSLQGIMGRYYAVADQEPKEVALALEEQYFPKQSGSPIPESRTGQILAIAEKMDTLTGIFSAGLIPTGDKDPYALRRATLGVLRIIIEGELPLNILDLLDFSLTQFNHEFDLNATHSLLKNFIFERLKHYNLEQGYTANEFEAVFAVLPEQPLDFQQRLQAVKAFRELPEAESLASANKRIRNILKKSGTAQNSNIGVLVEKEEIKLLESAQVTASEVKPLLEQHDYQAALTCLAQLRNDVDAFFDHVMVMCDDPELRANRLSLLAMLSDQFLQIADISKLQS